MAVEKSTETPVPAGFIASAWKPQKQADNEKISCRITTSDAVSLLGKTVLVELHWDDEPESYWYCLHIVGMVVPMEGVFDQAYFLTFGMNGQGRFPNEVFFSDIHTLRVLEQRRH